MIRRCVLTIEFLNACNTTGKIFFFVVILFCSHGVSFQEILKEEHSFLSHLRTSIGKALKAHQQGVLK